jgi:hypothetical protein
MMVNMKETELAPLLANDNENGVPKVPDLGKVKEIEKVGQRRIFRVKVITGKSMVSSAVGNEKRLHRHVGTHENLRHIVNKFNRVRVHSRHPSLHDGRSDHHKYNVYYSDGNSASEVRKKPALSFSQKILSMNISISFNHQHYVGE